MILFLLSFAEFELLVFYINIVKTSVKTNKRTSWKSASKLPTLQISTWFAFIFTMGKSENIWFLKINV